MRANPHEPSFGRRLWLHALSLLAWKPATRPWHFPVLASLCVGIPALTGVAVGRFDAGVLGSIGGLVILYMPHTPVPHRMVTLAVSALGLTACFALGVATGFNPYLSAATLGLVTALVTLVTRYFALPPPGSFFFVLVTAVAGTLPFDPAALPAHVGLFVLGAIQACLLAFFYSLLAGNRAPAAPPHRPPAQPVAALVPDVAVIGAFVGGSLLLAQSLGLHNPYWVPISCAAIMQGATFRAVWHRQVHRIAGTAIGMGLTWLIFSLPFNAWGLVAVIMALNFLVEFLVVRHYGLAVIFITPLTVLLAEASAMNASPDQLVLARMLDIVLGSVIGFVGGGVLHHPELLRALGLRRPRAE
ncbi:FUSC family protein [Thiobacillus sedimenti]|uniref:FUSC family protein n=1 Tax=Thiobacillus sedimenti TaxID=3110231 RepID=A0ABZ1CEN4_9PROT|nr:FUSC family protein [Thiobacillus sp. SCUT-2]WRS37845.1 FUSC family protein [Thiobacillus sp. SCUT-2]